MIKHMIQRARIKFFEPGVSGEAGGTVIHLPAGHLALDPMAAPSGVRRLTAEQQRIELLETQNRQLRADIDRCRKSSLGFAHEMRRLLTD